MSVQPTTVVYSPLPPVPVEDAPARPLLLLLGAVLALLSGFCIFLLIPAALCFAGAAASGRSKNDSEIVTLSNRIQSLDQQIAQVETSQKELIEQVKASRATPDGGAPGRQFAEEQPLDGQRLLIANMRLERSRLKRQLKVLQNPVK